MTIEEMKDEQIDKVELEHFRVREELQMQLQQCAQLLVACRAERIKRAKQPTGNPIENQKKEVDNELSTE